MEFKVGQEVISKNGCKGRIICIDAVGSTPIIVLYKIPYLPEETCFRLRKDGVYPYDPNYNIVIPKVKKFVAVWLHPKGLCYTSGPYPNRDAIYDLKCSEGVKLHRILEYEEDEQ